MEIVVTYTGTAAQKLLVTGIPMESIKQNAIDSSLSKGMKGIWVHLVSGLVK